MLKGHRILLGLAAAALPLGPLSAQISDAECATLRLLANSEADLSALSLQYRAGGTMDLQTGGRADLLAGATECEIMGDDGLTLNCDWRSDARADAQARFNQFRAAFDRCIPWAEMKYAKDPYAATSLKVLERYSGEAGGDEYGAGSVDVSLQFVEYTTYDEDIYYWVEFEFRQ